LQLGHVRNARIARSSHPHLAHFFIATRALCEVVKFDQWSNWRCNSRPVRKFIDYKTSKITDEDPLRGLLFY